MGLAGTVEYLSSNIGFFVFVKNQISQICRHGKKSKPLPGHLHFESRRFANRIIRFPFQLLKLEFPGLGLLGLVSGHGKINDQQQAERQR